MCVSNKLYELSEKICIRVEKNSTNHQNKKLYIPNKLYELRKQICICVKQILQTTTTNHLYVPNKLYELPEQISNMYTYRINSINHHNKSPLPHGWSFTRHKVMVGIIETIPDMLTLSCLHVSSPVPLLHTTVASRRARHCSPSISSSYALYLKWKHQLRWNGWFVWYGMSLCCWFS
jgi:hypothetical protein